MDIVVGVNIEHFDLVEVKFFVEVLGELFADSLTESGLGIADHTVFSLEGIPSHLLNAIDTAIEFDLSGVAPLFNLLIEVSFDLGEEGLELIQLGLFILKYRLEFFWGNGTS